jgi:type III pantothenate kinase
MYLLVDIGNTRYKAAIYESGSLSLVSDLATLDGKQAEIKGVFIANVGAEEVIHSIKQQLSLLDVPWIQIQSEATAFGVYNSYSEPEKLGVDRWLAMIAAKHQFPNQALLVIDAGTAVTMDWLDQQGRHQGGWILPGLALQQRAVVTNTAKVVNSTEGVAQLLPANNTISALQAGCLAAVVGAIQLAWQSQPVQRIVLTGGDSNLLVKHLALLPVMIEPLLVFHGLSRYCDA